MLLFVAASRKKEAKEWQRARLIAYTTYCSTVENKGRVSIYEFMPLPEDPTPAEIERIRRKEDEKKGKEMIREAAKVLKYYTEKGQLKLDK